MALDYIDILDADGVRRKVACDSIPGDAIAQVAKLAVGGLDAVTLLLAGAQALGSTLAVNTTPDTGFAPKKLSVGTSAVRLRAGGSELANRRLLTVQALPTNTDYVVLGDAAVDPAGEFCAMLGPGGERRFEVGPTQAVYARSATSGQAVCIVEQS